MKISRKRASSLVITLLVLVVLSTIVVAFMQSMSVERLASRSVKNAYQARLAAEAGVNQVVSRLAVAKTFHFSVGDELIFATNYGLTLFVKEPGTTNVTSTQNLFSKGGSGNVAKLKISDSSRAYSYFLDITNSGGQTSARYAFWVEDENSKQNYAFPRNVNRVNVTNFNELPLVQRDGSPWPAAAYTVAGLSNALTRLTVPTVNQVLPTAGFSSSSPVDEQFYTALSPAVLLTPEGAPRLNLVNLKKMIDGDSAAGIPPIALAQGPNSARVQLVRNLLNENGNFPATDRNTPWKGGSLSFLTNTYPLVQARQIVADIIDYIDEDLIPTTDGVPGPTGPSGADLISGSKSGNDPAAILAAQAPPTFIGSEARITSSGSAISVVGHPFITYVGSGLQINAGVHALNSTRIYGWMQIVNPWEGTNTWRIGSDGYFVDMQVKLGGTVSGGVRGNSPQAPGSSGYFLLNSLSQNSGYDGSHSGRFIPPRGKVMFPREWHGSGFDLGNGYYTIDHTNQIAISGFSQQLEVARLIYRVNGQRYLVQDLGALNGMPRTYTPNPVTLGGSSVTIKYPYPQVDWHYVGDPRLNFQTTNWIFSVAGGSGNGPAVANIGNQVYTSPINTTKDAQQGLTDNAFWWSNSSVTNHFPGFAQGYRPSVPAGQAPMLSYAEFGFIWAGKPWQTLNLSGAGHSNSLAADLRIMEYVDLGVLTNRSTNSFGQIMIDGQINVNSRKLPTMVGLLSGLSGAPAGGSLAASVIASSTNALQRPTDLFTLSNSTLIVTNNSLFDFGKEKLYGQLAPLLTTSASRFTVYSLGEALQNGKVVSSVLLQATVELVPFFDGTNTTLRPVVRVIKQL